MSIVDIIIVVFILFGGLIGFKRGVMNEFVKATSFVIITVLAFLFKNPLSIIFYENLPFFKFGGVFKGVTVLNIALYELIAFFIVFLILTIVWKLIYFATSIIQKIVNATIILGLPSKILGFIIGVIEYYLITFVVIYVLTLPLFSFKLITESKYALTILNDTFIVSDIVDSNDSFIDEFMGLKDKYKNSDSATSFNYETLDLFLKYDVISVDSVIKLKEKNKLKIDGLDDLIKKYEVSN